MRYPIALVTKGLKKLSEEERVQLRVSLKADEDKLAAAPNASARRSVVAEVLRRYADKLTDSTALSTNSHDVSREVRLAIDKASSNAGFLTVIEQDRIRSRIKASKEQLAEYSSEASRMLIFLELMAAAGETHVSAHGIKQAGYDPALLATAVLAAQEVENAKSAR